MGVGPHDAVSQRARSTRRSSQTGRSDSRTFPSAPKTKNRSKVRANQRSWVTASTVPSNSSSACLQRLGRLDVEVVGRLVEQQQRGARRAPAAGSGSGPAARPTASRTAPRRCAVARSGERAGRRLTVQARPRARRRRRGSRAASGRQLGVLMGLDEPARADPRTERARPVWSTGATGAPTRPLVRLGIGSAARQQAQEVRLARAVRAEHGDAVAVPGLEVERFHQPGEAERLAA